MSIQCCENVCFHANMFVSTKKLFPRGNRKKRICARAYLPRAWYKPRAERNQRVYIHTCIHTYIDRPGCTNIHTYIHANMQNCHVCIQTYMPCLQTSMHTESMPIRSQLSTFAMLQCCNVALLHCCNVALLQFVAIRCNSLQFVAIRCKEEDGRSWKRRLKMPETPVFGAIMFFGLR